MKAVMEAADPFMVFENTPPSNRELSDYVALEEGFGKKEVFQQMGDREEMLAYQTSIRKANFQESLATDALADYGFSPQSYNTFAGWDASLASAYTETYKKFRGRSIILDPDYHIQSGPRPAILMRMEEIWLKLSRDCASMIGFPLEFAQPMGAARSANVVGNIRFLNESVKKLRKDFRRIVRRMWLISYGQLVFNEVEKVRNRVLREPSLSKEFQLNEQIEIEIEWPCIPEMSYEQLRQFVLDEVIDHKTMAEQAAGLFGLPGSLINNDGGKLPEQYAMDLQRKQFQLQAKLQKTQAQSRDSPPRSIKEELPEEAPDAVKRKRGGDGAPERTLKGRGKSLGTKKRKIGKEDDAEKEVRRVQESSKNA
jgi:hypothetical protein